MNRLTFILLVVLGYTSCKTEREIPSHWVPDFKDADVREFILYDVKEYGKAEHPILFIGEKQKTIWIDHQFYSDANPVSFPGEKAEAPSSNRKYFIGQFSKATALFTEHPILRIYIDTTSLIGYSMVDADTFFKAYPVIIENRINAWTKIGRNNEVNLITEALDQNGRWQSIEEKFDYVCGTDVRFIALPPKETAISAVPVYQGTFKTRLRVRMDDIYSNEINGYIYPEQFLSTTE